MELHLGMRQTLNAPGIKYENIQVLINLEEYIKDIEVEMCNVDMDINETGYPTIGARNIMAYIGNSHYKSQYKYFELAKNWKRNISKPLSYKIAVAGCPNDCAKGHLMTLYTWSYKTNLSERKMYRLWKMCKSM